jgi:uncharacterized repeat protein (TIGR01451 family)
MHLKLYGSAALAAALALAPGMAQAAGTLAGSTITNTASLSFQVGGISQTAQSASNSVVVDRKVNMTLVNVGATTTVSPGQTQAVTTWTLTNTSNDTLDFLLATANQTSGATAQHGGTDAYDVSNFKYYVDTNANGVYDPGTDTLVTWIDELAPDTSKTIFVLSDQPLTATNTQVSGIVLTAQAAAGGALGTQGAALTATVGANTAGVDTVFADAAGVSDAANDGKISAKGDYTVSAAVLTVNKYATLISDPINGTTNPKLIPGAVVEYCIAVANAAGAATATGLSVSDPLPATVTYSASTVFLNATVSGSTCSGGTAGSDATNYNAGTTPDSGTLSNVAAGASTGLRFRVTIN